MSQAFVIFSGYNQRAVLAFCRFARAQRLPIHILAAEEDDPIYRTEYRSQVAFRRTSAALERDPLGAELQRLRTEQGVETLHVLPSSEYLNRFFLRHRAYFAELGVEIPLCDAPLYDRISDKESFCALCREAGLWIPEEVDPVHSREYPLVLKPKTYFDTRSGSVQFRPRLVHHEAEHRAALADVAMKEVYAQRFIRGRSFYLLYYLSQEGNHVVFSQENKIQQPGGRSMIGAIGSDLHRQPVAQEYLRFLLGLGFTGLVMVELREENGRYYMIEANPRLWGPSQFFLDCRVPIFETFAAELGYAITPRPSGTPPTAPRYFWGGGMEPGVAWHDYSAGQFAEEFPLWQRADVLLRPDTLDYYLHEISA